jgi:hypothetical protein
MTMHLVRGMSSLNTKKRRPVKKTKERLEAESRHESYLRRLGYKGTNQDYRYDIPDYKTERMTSDTIPSNGPKKKENTYTGNELAGIAVTHKSNLVPVRRDNKQAAIDVASMRR